MVVVPDVLANAGGVVVSYLEWVQNLQNIRWDRRQVDEELSRRLLDAYVAVQARATADGCSLRGGRLPRGRDPRRRRRGAARPRVIAGAARPG